jgi:hypothetical protein
MIFELMMTKSLKAMFRSLILFWIPVVVAIGFFGAVKVTELAVESVQPDGDDIAHVVLVDPYGIAEYGGVYVEIPYEVKQTSLGVREMISSLLRNHIKYEQRYFTDGSSYVEMSYWSDRNTYIYVKIKLENGITVTRSLCFTDEELEKLARYAVDESEEYKERLVTLPACEDIYTVHFRSDVSEFNEYGIEVNDYTPQKTIEMLYEEYAALSDEEKIKYRFVNSAQPDSGETFIYDGCYMDIYYENENGMSESIRLYLSDKYIPKTSRYVYERYLNEVAE